MFTGSQVLPTVVYEGKMYSADCEYHIAPANPK